MIIHLLILPYSSSALSIDTPDHLKKKDIPRIELGLLDSKSNVLTITPYVLAGFLSFSANNNILTTNERYHSLTFIIIFVSKLKQSHN
jgi:hypothetical protein